VPVASGAWNRQLRHTGVVRDIRVIKQS